MWLPFAGRVSERVKASERASEGVSVQCASSVFGMEVHCGGSGGVVNCTCVFEGVL